MDNFVYLYNGNNFSFTLKGMEGFKTKEQFKEAFEGKVDIDKAWSDIEKARPQPPKQEKKKSDDKGGDNEASLL